MPLSSVSSLRTSRDLRRQKAPTRMPGYDKDPQKFKAYFEKRGAIDTPYRVELLRDMSIARAMVLSEQWLDLSKSDREQWRSFRYHTPSPNSKFPRPVTNEIYPIYDNEVAKLCRRKSTSYVRPVAQQEGTSGAAGTAKANEILDWHYETISWSRKRRHAIRKMDLYGTVFFWSHLDQTFLDSVRIGLTDARRCVAGCGTVLASQQLPDNYPEIASSGGLRTPQTHPKDFETIVNYPQRPPTDSMDAEGMMEPYDASGELLRSYNARSCPKCGGGLDRWVPDQEEQEGEDLFGRSLAQQAPINQPDLDICGPDEIFLDNEGIGIDHIDDPRCRRILRVSPMPMDWVADHYPDLVSKVCPDDAKDIADRYFHSGTYGYMTAGVDIDQRDIWRDHVLVYWEVQKPSLRPDEDGEVWDKGRYTVFAGDIVLQDQPLYRKSTRTADVLVPLVKCAGARFFVKDGEYYGQGLVKPLVSPQARINMTWGQIVDTRQRHTVNGILVTEGTRMRAGWIEGYNGRFIKYTPDPSAPPGLASPQFLPARTIDNGVYQELDRTVERLQQISGTQDVDLGKAPRNVSAATAIQMLIEQSSGRRFMREEEFIDSFREIASHQLLLLAEYAVEPRCFRVKNAADKWEYRAFTGSDLEGHTDVVVEEQASYDARSFEREAIVQGIQLGVVMLSTPYARREAAKAIGIPMKISDEENSQITDAESKWYAFRDQKVVPMVDPDLDDHWLMFSVYGRFLKAQEGVTLAVQGGWAQVQPTIAGWEDRYQQALGVDSHLRQVFALAQQPPNPLAAQQGIPDETAVARQTIISMVEQGKDPRAMLLPRETTAQVLTVWQNMGVPPQLLAQPYTRFRAVVAAHKILFMFKKSQASGSPVPAAPGGMQTPMGTEPTAGNMPLPGPGSVAPGVAQNVTNSLQG